MQESIYNLIPKPSPEYPEKLRYKSIHDPNAPLVGSTFGLHGTTEIIGKGVHELKKSCVLSSTFGPRPESTKVDPSDFLKKGSRKVRMGGKSRKKHSLKPSVPRKDDRPTMGLVSCKNFINYNAAEVISSDPKLPLKKNDMEGYEIGKVPSYLKKVKNSIEKENNFVDNYVRNNFENHNNSNESSYEIMDEDERKMIVDKLKEKWDILNSKYQKTCHRVLMETPGDVRRKETQEAELKQLEKDITKFTRPGPLLIEN